MSEPNWKTTDTAPEREVVLTKIDDERGVRNIQSLKRIGNLWFFPDGGMYVYYRPTHWATEPPAMTDTQETGTRRACYRPECLNDWPCRIHGKARETTLLVRHTDGDWYVVVGKELHGPYESEAYADAASATISVDASEK